MKIQGTASHNSNRRTANSNPTQSTPKLNIVAPCHQGLSESEENLQEIWYPGAL